jgi:hypothetical protein
MISRADLAKNYSLMEQYIRVTIKMVQDMGKENISGLMVAHIKEIFLRTVSRVEESSLGKMEEYIMENGSITKWKEMES